jgi:hypothetical protein
MEFTPLSGKQPETTLKDTLKDTPLGDRVNLSTDIDIEGIPLNPDAFASIKEIDRLSKDDELDEVDSERDTYVPSGQEYSLLSILRKPTIYYERRMLLKFKYFIQSLLELRELDKSKTEDDMVDEVFGIPKRPSSKEVMEMISNIHDNMFTKGKYDIFSEFYKWMDDNSNKLNKLVMKELDEPGSDYDVAISFLGAYPTKEQLYARLEQVKGYDTLSDLNPIRSGSRYGEGVLREGDERITYRVTDKDKDINGIMRDVLRHQKFSKEKLAEDRQTRRYESIKKNFFREKFESNPEIVKRLDVQEHKKEAERTFGILQTTMRSIAPIERIFLKKMFSEGTFDIPYKECFEMYDQFKIDEKEKSDLRLKRIDDEKKRIEKEIREEKVQKKQKRLEEKKQKDKLKKESEIKKDDIVVFNIPEVKEIEIPEEYDAITVDANPDKEAAVDVEEKELMKGAETVVDDIIYELTEDKQTRFHRNTRTKEVAEKEEFDEIGKHIEEHVGKKSYQKTKEEIKEELQQIEGDKMKKMEERFLMKQETE